MVSKSRNELYSLRHTNARQATQHQQQPNPLHGTDGFVPEERTRPDYQGEVETQE